MHHSYNVAYGVYRRGMNENIVSRGEEGNTKTDA